MDYTTLITSEHADKPDFAATVALITQSSSDVQALLNSLPGRYDMDAAVGKQLDAVGLWIGRSRELVTPLTGVYFSWGTADVGWKQGTWKGPFDPSTGLVSLPDDAYRNLLRAVAAANQWDGSIPHAYAIWNQLISSIQLLIQDNGDMSMYFALLGPLPDAVTFALLVRGYLNLKPAGVRIRAYITETLADTPFFGWGVENSSISGWGVGAWGKFNPPE